MNRHIARLIIHSWPFRFGYGTIMKKIKTKPHPEDYVISKLRGYQVSIKYNPNSYIGSHIWYRGIFEETIVSAITSNLKNGMTFIDIGANIGLHTIVAASKVGNKGKVIAIEPQQSCIKLLKENVALNKLNNVTVIDHALGSTKTEGKIFHVNDNNDAQATLRATCAADQSKYETIQIRTLDSLMQELGINHADVVKVDIEGSEVQMLKGGESFFNKTKPEIIIMECIDEHLCRFGNSSTEILSWFKNKGYKAYFLARGRWIAYDSTEMRNGDIMFTRKNKK